MRKRSKNPPRSRDVEYEHEGKVYRGSYVVEKGLITVSHDFRSETTQVGGHRGYEQLLARVMLSQMVRRPNIRT